MPAGFDNTAHVLTCTSVKSLRAVCLAKSNFCLPGARLEQDLIVIVSSPPLSVPLRPDCPPQIVYSPAFLPVSAQSWEQMMQIIHLLKMGLKTSTTGSLAVCVLAALAGQTLSLAT